MNRYCVARTGSTAAALALLFFVCAGYDIAAAQTYPQRPVRLIVNVSPGGGVDIGGRIVGQLYATIWDKPLIVDTRSGAGGNTGVDLVVNAPANGYTLLVGSSTVVTNAATNPEG